MRIKFIQKGIDHLNGKVGDISHKKNLEDQLISLIETAKNEEISALTREVNQAKNSIETFNLTMSINLLNGLQQKTKWVVSAIKSGLTHDIAHIERILGNPNEHYQFLSLINYDPLHLLVAAHVLKGLDYSAEITKLLKYDALDYSYEAYRVIPAVEILKMENNLRDTLRQRMLKDILKLIDKTNFEKALLLISFDKEYFSKVIVPDSDGKSILFYAVKIAAKEKIQKAACDFISVLLANYGFDAKALDSNRINCLTYGTKIVNDAEIEPKKPSNNLNLYNFLNIYGRQEFITLDEEPLKLKDKYREILAAEVHREIQISVKSKYEHFCSIAEMKTIDEIAKMISSSYRGTNMHLYKINIGANVAKFIVNEIFTKVNSISLRECFIDGFSLQFMIEGMRGKDNIENFYIAETTLNKEHVLSIFDVLKDLPHLQELKIDGNQSIPISFIESIAELLSAEAGYFSHCSFYFENFHGTVDGQILFTIYEHMHLIGSLIQLHLRQIQFDSSLFSSLASLLHNDNKLTVINLVRLQINADAANELVKIVKNCKSLETFNLDSCTLDEPAKIILTQLKDHVFLKYFSISSCGMPDVKLEGREIKAPSPKFVAMEKLAIAVKQGQSLRYKEPQPLWKTTKIDKLQKALKGDIGSKYLRQPPKNILERSLSDYDLIYLESLFNWHKEQNQAQSIQYILNHAKNVIEFELSELRQNFFDEYLKELKTDGASNWSGSIAELHIIAKLLKCRINLHCETLGTEKIKVYGSPGSEKEIDIVRYGTVFYGYSSSISLQLLLPNYPDHLNMFRACMHPFLAESIPQDYSERLLTTDQCAIQLQNATAACLEHARNLCESEYQTALDQYIQARTIEECGNAIKKLPPLNLKIMEQIVSLKNMLDSIPELVTIAETYEVLDELNAQEKLTALLHGFAQAQNVLVKPYNMNLDNINALEISDLEIAELNNIFDKNAEANCAQRTKIIDKFAAKVDEANTAFRMIDNMREEAIKKLIVRLNAAHGQGMEEIQKLYNEMRKQSKKALLNASIAGLSSFIGVTIFGGAVRALLSATSFFNPLNAKLAADAIISTTVSQAVNGGNLKRLPENIVKNFAVTSVASGLTSAVIGTNLGSLPINTDLALARTVNLTQKTFEAIGSTALHGGNILQEGIITAATTGVVGGAFKVDYNNPTDNRILIDTTTVAIKSAASGANTSELMRAVTIQAIESSAIAIVEKPVMAIADTFYQPKPTFNVAAAPLPIEDDILTRPRSELEQSIDREEAAYRRKIKPQAADKLPPAKQAENALTRVDTGQPATERVYYRKYAPDVDNSDESTASAPIASVSSSTDVVQNITSTMSSIVTGSVKSRINNFENNVTQTAGATQVPAGLKKFGATPAKQENILAPQAITKNEKQLATERVYYRKYAPEVHNSDESAASAPRASVSSSTDVVQNITSTMSSLVTGSVKLRVNNFENQLANTSESTQAAAGAPTKQVNTLALEAINKNETQPVTEQLYYLKPATIEHLESSAARVTQFDPLNFRNSLEESVLTHNQWPANQSSASPMLFSDNLSLLQERKTTVKIPELYRQRAWDWGYDWRAANTEDASSSFVTSQAPAIKSPRTSVGELILNLLISSAHAAEHEVSYLEPRTYSGPVFFKSVLVEPSLPNRFRGSYSRENFVPAWMQNWSYDHEPQASYGLTFDDIDIWQETEFYERKPYYKVNEIKLLGGALFGLAHLGMDLAFGTFHLTVAAVKLTNEIFAEAQRFDDAWNYESVPNEQAIKVWSANQDYVRDEVRSFIPNVKMAAIAGYHNFADAMRNIEQDPFNAGYNIGYVGGSVAVAGYGTLALAKNSVPLISNIGKQTYLIGTKGYAQGRASYTLINSLNASPVVGATATELFASTNTPRQLLFSQIKNQGSRSSSSMYAQGNPASVVRPQSNSYQAAQLKIDLQQQTCRSLFTRDGRLTTSAIDNSDILLNVEDFDIRAPIFKELSQRGNVEDWFKYKTDKFYSPGVDIGLKQINPKAEIHFYKNAKTGEVYYGMDFKVKIDVAGQPHMTVQEFLNLLPKEWRPTF